MSPSFPSDTKTMTKTPEPTFLNSVNRMFDEAVAHYYKEYML